MSLQRLAARRDANEGAVVDAIERVGAEVWILARPADLLVWFRQRWHVLEIKTATGRFSPAQRHDRAKGLCAGIIVVRSPVEALRAIGAMS